MKKIIFTLSMLLVLLTAALASADIIWDLGNRWNGATPDGPYPWLTATFHDVDATHVELTLQGHLYYSATTKNFLDGDGWLFNFNPSLNLANLSFALTQEVDADNSITVANGATINRSANGIASGSTGGNFDIQFAWTGGAGNRFNDSDTLVYTITYDDPLIPGLQPISSAAFNFPSVGGDPNPFTSAHIQGTTDQGGATSGRVSEPGFPIPEPATMLLFGSGLFGVAAIIRRRFKK